MQTLRQYNPFSKARHPGAELYATPFHNAFYAQPIDRHSERGGEAKRSFRKPHRPGAKHLGPLEKELFAAIEAGDNDRVIAALEKGADVKKRSSSTRITPIMSAVMFGDVEIAETLRMRNETDVNTIEPEDSNTLLMVAILHDEDGFALNLINDPRIQLNSKNRFGMTELMLAALCNNVNVGRALLAKRVNPNATNDAHETALMIAAEYGYAEFINMLLDGVVDIHMVDSDGRTALSIARAYNLAGSHDPIIEMLQPHPSSLRP